MKVTILIFLFSGFALGLVEKVYKTDRLSNDLELIGMQSRKVPLVTIVLACKAGGFTEKPSTDGLTHLWEHMFFKGNGRLPNQEAFNKRVRQLGLRFNGDTSAEKVRYYFTMPSVFLEEGLQFMSDAIATPLLEQKELERERLVVLDEYDRAASQPGFDLRRIRSRILYGDKFYLRSPLGQRPLIEKATRKQLIEIKKEVFVPKNCALMVSGDFNQKNLKKLAEKHFKNWKTPKGWRPVEQNKFPAFPKTTDVIMSHKQTRNADVNFTFRGPRARLQPKDTFAADVLISLLDNRTGKFYKKFIDSGLCFQAGLSYATQAQAGETVIYAQTKTENLLKVKKMLLEEAKLWAKAGYFSQSQLEDVRRMLLINHKREINKPSQFIKTLAFWWSITGLKYYDSYLDNLRSTGLKEVQNYVKKYVIGKPYVSTSLLPPGGAKKIGLKENSDAFFKKFKISPGA